MQQKSQKSYFFAGGYSGGVDEQRKKGRGRIIVLWAKKSLLPTKKNILTTAIRQNSMFLSAEIHFSSNFCPTFFSAGQNFRHHHRKCCLFEHTGFHTLSQDRGTPSRICLSQSQDCGMMLENVDDT